MAKAKAKARKSSKKKSKAARRKAPKSSLTARIVVDPSDEIGTYYVNHAEVAHTRHEFMIYWCKIPTKPTPVDVLAVQNTGELHVEPSVQVIIPPTLIQGLINALSIQKEKYEQVLGKIQEDKS